MKDPLIVGIPVIVIRLLDQEAVTPEGKPTGVPIPEAPVVAMVITGFRGVLMQSVGLEEGLPAELDGVLLTVSVVEFAHCPAVGVNVYVPAACPGPVHVPVIGGTLVDEVGKVGAGSP